MAYPSAWCTFLILAISYIFVRAQDVEGYSSSSLDNHFTTPPSSGDGDYMNNREYLVGSVVDVEWTTSFSSFYFGIFQGVFYPGYTTIHWWPYTWNRSGAQWELKLDDPNLDPPAQFSIDEYQDEESKYFGFIIADYGSQEWFASHLFNLTDTFSSSSSSSSSISLIAPTSTSSPSSSTQLSSSPATMTGQATTSGVTPTSTRTSAEHEQTPDASSGLSKGGKIGVGVGVALGVAVLAAGAAAAFFFLRKRRGTPFVKGDGEAKTGDIEYTGDRTM